jgi:hypothetical protein
MTYDFSDSHYLIDITDNIHYIAIFNAYIKFCPDFYQQKVNHRIIVVDTLASQNLSLDDKPEMCIIYDEPVKFNDRNFDVSGYIVTNYNVETLINGTIKKTYTFKIWIAKSSSPNSKQYHILVQDYMKQEARHGNRVQLYYHKILNEQLITHNFYDRKLVDWTNDVKQLRDEFFSPHKRYLFDVMTQKNRNGNWSNLILHGEPGTGKSSFVFRLATQLKMSIISVDLSMYIDRKRDLYSIFHGNEFYLPYGKGQKLTVSQNCIIILEEFDSSIEKIKQLENIFQFKSNTIHSYVNNKTSEIGRKVHDSIDDFLQPDIPLNTPAQYLQAKRNANNELDPLKINNEILEIVRTITEDNKSDILRLRDLLELFQGPVPVRDRIIVATTNNFEQIRNIIPPLFRPGRLTPIKFTYLDWPSLQELSQYYFRQETIVEPFEILIPTSQITELAIKYISMARATAISINELYQEFIRELIELNTAKKNAKIEQPRVEQQRVEQPRVDQQKVEQQRVEQQRVEQHKQTVPQHKSEVYAKWMDEKLGISQPPTPVAQTQQQPKSAPSAPTRTRQIQRRPVARTTQPKPVDDDDRIRTMAVEKVMTKDRTMMAKLPGYNQDELVNDYLQVAVMTPQHDDEY